MAARRSWCFAGWPATCGAFAVCAGDTGALAQVVFGPAAFPGGGGLGACRFGGERSLWASATTGLPWSPCARGLAPVSLTSIGKVLHVFFSARLWDWLARIPAGMHSPLAVANRTIHIVPNVTRT